MANTGTLHVRPVITWVIRRDSTIEARGAANATVLLPGAKIREGYPLKKLDLPPGKHEIWAVVDFQDGLPMQSMTRTFEVGIPAPAPVAAPPPAAQ
jgi:hypothetical protein